MKFLTVFIDAAEKHGAKFHRSGIGRWIVLDQQNSPLWHREFLTKLGAARAYCRIYGIVP